jgi:hypothetical protein
MGLGDLNRWFSELAAMDNPVRREFHLFTLLSGSRPTAIQEIKPKHLDRAIRFGREMYPLQAAQWVFPAGGAPGHIAETKEDRDELSKWGNDLRQTFRNVATAAGVSDFDAKLLMNHAIPGANADYVTRHKFLEDHPRCQKQAIRSAVFAVLRTLPAENPGLRRWLGRGVVQRAVFEPRGQAPQSDGKPASVLRAAQ